MEGLEVKGGLRFGTFNIDGESMRLDQDCKRGNGLLRADRILLPFCFIAYLGTLSDRLCYMLLVANVVVYHWALAHSVLFVFLTGK